MADVLRRLYQSGSFILRDARKSGLVRRRPRENGNDSNEPSTKSY
jgi:hypothetical protein